MLKNIIKITLRNFWRDKTYTFINLLGLATGLCTCILIFLFIQDEVSYDNFHQKAERIFRLESFSVESTEAGDEEYHWAATVGNLIPALVAEYPSIEKGCKVLPISQPVTMTYKENRFNEPNLLYVDSTFLDIFSFGVLAGNPSTALAGPGKMVLTQSLAKKYFGSEDPMGKSIQTDHQTYTVTGLIKDVPSHSHIHFEGLVSLDDLRTRRTGLDEGGPSAFYSYVLLNNEASLVPLKEKLATDIYRIRGIVNEEEEAEQPEGYSTEVLFNNVRDIHLGGNAEKEMEANAEMGYLYLFGLIALFILLIASFNYMNLATARSAGRAREVGVRKVLGAFKTQLFWQFLGESLVMVFLATCLALLAVELILPGFNSFTGKTLHLTWNGNLIFWATLLAVITTLGFISGSYPALYLSSFNPLKVLKGSARSGSATGSALWLRKVLVVAQFAISVTLIIGAVTVYRQMQFISTKSLGFSKEQVIVVPTGSAKILDQLPLVKETLAAVPEVIATTPTSTIPGKRVHIMGVRIPDLATEPDEESDGSNGGRGMRIISIDEDAEETFGFKIVQGRGLSKEFSTDARAGFLVNEAAVRDFGFEDPIGRPFEYTYGVDTPKVGTIVGVVKDFHYASMHTEIEPLMMHVWPDHYSFLSIKIKSDDMASALKKVGMAWQKIATTVPFDYFFLDDYYGKMYKTESSLSTLMAYFTFLAIFIACLGLFGLSAFSAQQRTREIGIRKVLGASVQDIILLLSKNIASLVLVSFVIALPAAAWAMDSWLEGFAYRVDLSPWIFLIVGVVAIGIALLTVSLQSVKAALANPIEALKDE